MNIFRVSIVAFCAVIVSSTVEAGPFRRQVYYRPATQTATYPSTYQSVPNTYQSVSRPRGVSQADVQIDPAAYAFAVREATLQASRQSVGHLLGIAPGCNGSGVGSSHSPGSPNHCVSGGRLVARAGVQGADGKWYWSAHYR